jgi:ABC-type phosphate transport system substrate-binding protein
MRLTLKARLALAGLSAIGATAVTSNALAVDCNTLQNPVYVTGSSAVEPFMTALGAALYPNISIVYQRAGSCVGVNAMVKNTPISGTAKYYPAVDDAGLGVPTDCTLPVNDAGTGGQPVDLGVSDVFPESCPGGTADPAKVGDFWGPNQVMVFVAPQKATQVTNISAEAAYFVMGQPAGGKTVAPWTDSAKLYIRNNTSGTQTMISAAIHLDAASWHGTDSGSAAMVEANIKTAQMTDPAFQSVLGIVSTGEADRDRDFMKVLGFQDSGQKCAYWPDSSLTSFDKKWVRTGEYPIWGPLHMLAAVASAGAEPTNASVKKIVHYFAGSEVPPGGKNQIVDLEISTHTIPQCAMKVKRTKELGPYAAYTDANPCGCYFDAHVPGGTVPASCKTCMTNDDCGDAGNMTCSYGYCEAK